MSVKPCPKCGAEATYVYSDPAGKIVAVEWRCGSGMAGGRRGQGSEPFVQSDCCKAAEVG